LDETAPLHPIALVAWRPPHEDRVLQHGRGGRPIVLRPGVVYGHGGGIPGGMVHAARSTGVVQVVGDGTTVWPLVHVDDLAALYLAALERGAAKAIYNAAPTTVTTREFAEAVASHTGARVEYVPVDAARAQMGPFADALATSQSLSSAKAERDLDWNPSAPSILADLAAAR
jgi:nucleoside-diphosphate-sugar epimerase